VESLSVDTLTTDTVRVQWQVRSDSTQQEFQVRLLVWSMSLPSLAHSIDSEQCKLIQLSV